MPYRRVGVPYLTEFLKAAIIQSHDCTKYLIICANFGLVNAKLKKKTGTYLMYFFLQVDKVFLVSQVFIKCLTHVSAQNFQSEHVDFAKEFAFRKSGSIGGSRLGH